MSALKKLREQRNAVVTAMTELVNRADAEGRGFTVDDDAAWAKAEADITQIDQRIAKAERIGELGGIDPSAAKIIAPAARTGADSDETRAKADEAGRVALRQYLKCGASALTPEQRAVLPLGGLSEAEQRAFAAGTANVGGATVPQGFVNELEQALVATGAMWDVADILPTDTGNPLPWPTLNYTGVSGTRLGEGASGTADSSTPFSSVTFNAYTYRSAILQVSWEFLQDTAFDESFIQRALTESLWRITNTEFTTGTGTSQPQGIATAAVAGKTGLTGQTTTVIYDDLVDLIHSVDPAYRVGGNSVRIDPNAAREGNSPVGGRVGFMMRDASVAIVRKLKDSQGMPIWTPSYQSGLATGVPDTLLGYPVFVNQSVAAMAANAKSILFGRMDKYKIRLARQVTALRLTERYADNGQVAFYLFLRADGRLLDAGTNPVKAYVNSAT